MRISLFFIFSLSFFLSCENDNVNEANSRPFFVSMPDTISKVGIEYQYIIEVDDEESNDVTIDLTSGPTWISLDSNILSGIPESVGDYSILLTASDQKGSSSQSYVLEVLDNLPPVVSNLPEIINMNFDQERDIELELSDPEDEDVQVVVDFLPNYVTYNAENKSFLVLPTFNNIGKETLSFFLNDGTNSIKKSIEINVYQTFHKTYLLKRILNITETRDGGILLNCYIHNTESEIVKIDKFGDIEWKTTVVNYITQSSLIELPNGRIIHMSRQHAYLENLNGLDEDGNILWTESDYIPSTSGETGMLSVAGEDAFLFVYTYYINFETHYFIEKRNSDNELIWNQYSTIQNNQFQRITPFYTYKYNDLHYIYGRSSGYYTIVLNDGGIILDTLVHNDNFYSQYNSVRFFPDKDEFIIDYPNFNNIINIYSISNGNIVKQIDAEVMSSLLHFPTYLEYDGYGYQFDSFNTSNTDALVYLKIRNLSNQTSRNAFLHKSSNIGDDHYQGAYLNNLDNHLISVFYIYGGNEVHFIKMTPSGEVLSD
jgi:hypothetical protein